MVTLFAQQSNIVDFPRPQQSSEWHTPPHVIEAAREVMQGIELDPASCKEANMIVRAQRYYTAKDNGLIQEWKARSVWLNPPYGRTLDMKARHQSTIEQFTTKLIQEYETGNIEQAILLVPATIGTNWFIPLWQYPLCFHSGKLNFLSPDKHSCYSHAYGTVLAYLGSREQRFIDIFSRYGRIAKAIDTPRQQVTPLSLWEGV